VSAHNTAATAGCTRATTPPAEGFAEIQRELDVAATLIGRGSLEDVRALLRQPIFTQFLGFTPGLRGNAQNLKPSPALVAAGVSKPVLDELLLALKRLDDFCLSNRVIVFNARALATLLEDDPGRTHAHTPTCGGASSHVFRWRTSSRSRGSWRRAVRTAALEAKSTWMRRAASCRTRTRCLRRRPPQFGSDI